MDPLDPILAGLTTPQAEAAMHDGAILVLAGACTGKTRSARRARSNTNAWITKERWSRKVRPKRAMGARLKPRPSPEDGWFIPARKNDGTFPL